MRIEPGRKLFVGVRIDNKMREQLDKCPARDRAFFMSEDARYLTVLRGEADSYIGKLVDGATAATAMDDLRRNVVSILNRVCPGRRDEDEVKVYATDEGDPPVAEALESKKREEGGGDRQRGYY